MVSYVEVILELDYGLCGMYIEDVMFIDWLVLFYLEKCFKVFGIFFRISYWVDIVVGGCVF